MKAVAVLGVTGVLFALACGGSEDAAAGDDTGGGSEHTSSGSGATGGSSGGSGAGPTGTSSGGASSSGSAGTSSSSGAPGSSSGTGASSSGGGSSSSGSAGTSSSSGGSGSSSSSGGSSSGGSIPTVSTCGGDWNAALPATGNAMMAFGAKTYLFGTDGVSWTVVDHGAATTSAIPLPNGVTVMRSVRTEIAPSGRPFVRFDVNGQAYGAFFDGQSFVKVTAIAGLDAHADASERIYAIGPNGLVEYDAGTTAVRGALSQPTPVAWTVGAEGTVHVFYPHTDWSEHVSLHVTHLTHGELAWHGEEEVTWNAGYGFGGTNVTTAPDGSIHVVYALSYSSYEFRSHDGVTWDARYPTDIVSQAAFVDPVVGADPWGNDDRQDVQGNIVRIAAQDYEHLVIIRAYNGGSMSYPAFYVTRACEPYSGTSSTWPSERFTLTVDSYLTGYPNAVNEHGQPSLLTATGVRQEVAQ